MHNLLRFLLFFIPFFPFLRMFFKDFTKESGIDHVYDIYESGGFGGGVAVFDFNNDGFEDLYITGGKSSGKLYKNNGNSTFSDVTYEAGLLTNNVITAGATTTDVNKDGYIDLFITTIAEKVNDSKYKKIIKKSTFLNTDSKSFKLVSDEFKLNINNFSAGAVFGDINSDGYPDLFVGNYFKDFAGNLGVLNGFTISDDYKPGADKLY